VKQKSSGRAGLNHREVKVVMNPVDHPHGVGKGGIQLVKINPHTIGVILWLEVGKGKKIVSSILRRHI